MTPIMKKFSALALSITLALGTIGTAQADWDHHGGHRGYRDHREYRSGPGWAGPAALLAITGLAIGAAAYAHSAPAPVYSPAPVYVEPAYVPAPRPVQVAPESGSWYYCGSSGQYYPYVRYCPEGWQQVMPPR